MSPRIAIAALALTASAQLHAATIDGADTFGLSTSYTTGDGLVTLFAYQSTDSLVAGAFNSGNSNFIGVSNLGNVNAVNDVDGDPTTGDDQEAIDIALSPTVGLSSIGFNFSRAEGPAATDGIQIAGFASDPGASATGTYADLRWDAGTNSIYFELAPADFNTGGQLLTFSNLSASGGQTLRLTANDSSEAGSQAAITVISYDPIPEPSIALLAGLGLFGLLRRRR